MKFFFRDDPLPFGDLRIGDKFTVVKHINPPPIYKKIQPNTLKGSNNKNVIIEAESDEGHLFSIPEETLVLLVIQEGII